MVAIDSIYENVQQRSSYGTILLVLVLSRLGSEIINNFVWPKANYAWSLCALPLIAGLLAPFLLMIARRDGRILITYLPVFGYLSFLLVRTPFSSVYSMKCLFSELIVWFFFIFATEISSRVPSAAQKLRLAVIWSVKIIVLIGTAQLAWAVISTGSFSPAAILDLRPVKGIFIHPNIYLVVLLPFTFLFLKQRSYLWIILTLVTCVSTGTRSPFLAALCLFILIYKSALRNPITRTHIAITLVIIAVAYAVLIKANSYGWEFENVDSRATFGTLQWRVHHWRGLLQTDDAFSMWLGHGVASADLFETAKDSDAPLMLPHNDYLRIFHDTGIIGLLLFLNLIFFMVRLLSRSITTDNDFIMLAYLVIICFYITDNFIYATHSVWVFMFIATFLTPSASGAKGTST